MLTLTTPDGHTITGSNDVGLAAAWLDHQHGIGWEDGVIPFDEHNAIHGAIEDIALIADGHLPGYTVTDTHHAPEPTTFDH